MQQVLLSTNMNMSSVIIQNNSLKRHIKLSENMPVHVIYLCFGQHSVLPGVASMLSMTLSFLTLFLQ